MFFKYQRERHIKHHPSTVNSKIFVDFYSCCTGIRPKDISRLKKKKNVTKKKKKPSLSSPSFQSVLYDGNSINSEFDKQYAHLTKASTLHLYLCCCYRLFFPLTTNWILMFFRPDIFRSANYCSFECGVCVCAVYINLFSDAFRFNHQNLYTVCINIFKYTYKINNLTGSGMNKHFARTYSLDDDFDYFMMCS